MGGFPYQFKSLCPSVTYVISDFPELFLFSATYLMTAFPDAEVGFWGQGPTDRLFARWARPGLYLRPEHSAHRAEAAASDLTLNIVSFQEMTQAQVVGSCLSGCFS